MDGEDALGIDGRRRPEAVAFPGEDAEEGRQAGDGLKGFSGGDSPRQLVFAEKVGEDGPHNSLSSSRRMNSASIPAAARPSRLNTRPLLAFAGRSGQVRLARKASQPKRTCSISSLWTCSITTEVLGSPAFNAASAYSSVWSRFAFSKVSDMAQRKRRGVVMSGILLQKYPFTGQSPKRVP